MYFIPILFLLALNYKCLGNYLKTLNIYRKILFRNRDDDAILENIGFFFLEQGKIKKAYHYLKKGHDINPKENNILWNISMCQFKTGDLYNGFKLFEKRWDVPASGRTSRACRADACSGRCSSVIRGSAWSRRRC